MVVKRNVDEQLDGLKRIYDGMNSMLSEVAKTISETLPDDVATKLNVIYFPQLGYLIVIPLNPQNGESEFMMHDWEFQFSTATSFYYKSPQMREMDGYFGDMHGLICGEFKISDLWWTLDLQYRCRSRNRTCSRFAGTGTGV